MKSDKLILAFLGVALLLFGAGVAYKLTRTPPAPAGKAAVTAAAPRAKALPKTQPPRAGAATKQDPLKGGAIQPVFYVQEKIKTLGQKITAALNQRRITLDDLERLEFNGGGSAGEFDVFNPQGRIGFVPAGGLWITQEVVDRMAEDSRLVYNLRRVRRNGVITETLYAIIPDVDAKSCGPAGGNIEYSVNAPVVIAPDNHTIIEDSTQMPAINTGCLTTSEGKRHWFHKLRVRTKVAKAQRWGSY
jgi:hypothetical protein